MKIQELLEILAPLPVTDEVVLEVGGDGAIHNGSIRSYFYRAPNELTLSGEPE